MCLFSNGDINWIAPGEIMACSSPIDEHIAQKPTNNTQVNDSAKIAKILSNLKVRTIVRLNDRLYDESTFTQNGLVHRDFVFEDGGVPSAELVRNFLNFCHHTPKPIVIHCRAGHGRTGTMICIYLFSKYRASMAGLVAWCKICRPNSITQMQFNFLKKYEHINLAHSSIPRPTPKNLNASPLSISHSPIIQSLESNTIKEAKMTARTAHRNRTVDLNLNNMPRQVQNTKPLGEISLNIQVAPSTQIKSMNPLQMTPQFNHIEHQRVRTASIPVKIDPYFHSTNPKNPTIVHHHQHVDLANRSNKNIKNQSDGHREEIQHQPSYTPNKQEEYGILAPDHTNSSYVHRPRTVTDPQAKNDLTMERSKSKENSQLSTLQITSNSPPTNSPFNPLATPIKRNKVVDQYSHTDKPSDSNKHHNQDRSVNPKQKPVIIPFPSKPMPVLSFMNDQGNPRPNGGVQTSLFFSSVETNSNGGTKNLLDWSSNNGLLSANTRQTVNLGSDLSKYISNNHPQNRLKASPYNFVHVQHRKAPPVNQPTKTPMKVQDKNISIFAPLQQPIQQANRRESSKGPVLQVPIVTPKSYLTKN